MTTDRPLKPLSAYPQHLVRTASWRREIIQPLIDAKQLTRAIVRQRVLEMNAQFRESGVEDPAKQVSIASVYRWMRAFRQSEGDLRSLIPYSRRDTAPAKTRLSPAVDTIIETVIRDLYWSREQVSIALVQHTVLLRIEEVNHTQPEQDRLSFPSGTTIFRRLRAWKSRQGEITSLDVRRTTSNRSQQCIEQSTIVTSPMKPTRPNQYVEFHAVFFDMLVTDTEDSLPLGQPLIVFLRDCYTGYLTGCRVSFDPLSPSNVLECLFSAITKKTDIRTRYHTQHDYLGYGIPEVLLLDDDYSLTHPHLERVCRHLGIHVQRRPVSSFSLKSPIEHLHRTLLQHLSSFFMSPYVSFEELRQALYQWIVDDQAQQLQHGVGEGSGVPAELWRYACEQGFVPRTVSVQTAATLLLPHTVERRMRRDGIWFEQLRYYPNACSSTRPASAFPLPNTPLQIIYDPEDLSRLWALDASSQRTYELRSANQEYTAHLSIWKHQQIKRFARTHVQQDVDLAALKLAKTRLQQFIRTHYSSPEKEVTIPQAEEQRFHFQFAPRMDEISPHEENASSVEPRWSEAHSSTAHHNQGTILGRKKTLVEQSTMQDPPLDPKQWGTMLPSRRLGLIESLFIEHDRLKPLMTEFHALAQSSDATEANAPHCLAVLGEAGVGKTALVKIWIKSASRQLCQLTQGEQMRPYRYLSLPAPATPKGILASFLLELEGTPVSLRGTEWNMMERLQRAIQTTSVRLLFIDDMQHLLNRETQRTRYACVEILEHITRQTGVPMIFLGSLNETEPVFRVSPRLERLVGTPRLLRPFEWNPKNGATMQEFCMLLRTIDRYLPFDLSGLDEEEIASGFFSATDGILGWIMKLIRYAAGQAIQEQEATLSKSQLAAAYDACIAHTTLGFGKRNPFATLDRRSTFLGHREERSSHYYAKRM